MIKQVNAILITLKEIASKREVWLRFIILIVAGFAGAMMFSKTKTTSIQQSTGQCDWLIQQNKELISFITSPRRYNRKALDSLVQMDSIKKERSGIYSP